MATFRGLLRLRPVLPAPLWQFLWRRHWDVFWKKELEVQRAQLRGYAPSHLLGSERALLCEGIAESYPAASLLEVGCAYGQLFQTIAPLFPELKLTGIDADEERVEGARAAIFKSGIRNTSLLVGRAEDLSRFADKSFDLVVTSAMLLYVEPKYIEGVISGFMRVGRKRLLLLEQHLDDDKATLGLPGNQKRGEPPYWLRDYRRLLRLFLPPERISVRPVTRPLWLSEEWQQRGCLITADLK